MIQTVDLSISNPEIQNLITHYVEIGLRPQDARRAAVEDVYAVYCNKGVLPNGSEVSEHIRRIMSDSRAGYFAQKIPGNEHCTEIIVTDSRVASKTTSFDP